MLGQLVQSTEKVVVVIIIVRSMCTGKNEILGNKLEVFFFFSIPSAKMYIDCNWKETTVRGKMMLSMSQILFNILIA